LAAGLLIWLTMGRPVLFRQQRPGLYARSFTLLKLRTMTEARGLDGELLPDAKRLTHVGRWLRKLSIDELPQLWNVLRGEMSLVGPRPLLIEYLPRYTPEELRRHEVKPGITGWAQVNGRNEVPWADKFALDAWYVDHQSLWLDCVILLRSLVLCLSMQGISRPGHATAPEFRGLGKTPPRDGLALGGPPCEQS
jgi:lipopolysaccharide/colanic/teichoic acid biosynthesis glycosyltransferase